MNRIIIDIGIIETRIAIVENNELVNLFIERNIDKKILGNIYLGKIVNKIDSMNSFFVDIGLKKNGYLSYEDAMIINKKDIELGQNIVVQVKKEPMEGKGAKLSRNITLPGIFVVLTPFKNHIGFSKKILEEEKITEIKNVLNNTLPDNIGCIVRTKAKNVETKLIVKEIEELLEIFEKIEEFDIYKSETKLMYTDDNKIKKILKEYLNNEADEIVVNNIKDYNEIEDFVNKNNSIYKKNIKIILESGNIFKKHKIDKKISEGISRKVELKSGGYITIDETEALVAIDVNTGKYTGNKNLQDTLFNINKEATLEIARQIRLRNLSGIIIIDYIDMEYKENLKEIVDLLEEEMKKDKVKNSKAYVTKLGLVELTRKKSSYSVSKQIFRKCSTCSGLGRIASKENILTDIENLIREMVEKNSPEALVVEVSKSLKEYINENYKSFQKDIFYTFHTKLHLLENRKNNFNEFKIKRMGTNNYVEKYLYKNNKN